MAESEVARLRQRIIEEYEAAKRGLSGLASGVSHHTFITTRMENLGMIHEQLIELVGPDEAITLMAQTIWKKEDQGRASPRYTNQ